MPAPLSSARSRRRRGLALLTLLLVTTCPGCVSPAPATPATIRETLPPWSAPRDAISYIEAAGLTPLALNSGSDSRTVELTVTLDGRPVAVPSYLGVDRLRAVQAAVHTHDDSGTVWLEGTGADRVTLGQLFLVWGVRFDRRCLGSACGGVTVSTSAEKSVTDPRALVLADVRSVQVAARTS